MALFLHKRCRGKSDFLTTASGKTRVRPRLWLCWAGQCGRDGCSAAAKPRHLLPVPAAAPCSRHWCVCALRAGDAGLVSKFDTHTTAFLWGWLQGFASSVLSQRIPDTQGHSLQAVAVMWEQLCHHLSSDPGISLWAFSGNTVAWKTVTAATRNRRAESHSHRSLEEKTWRGGIVFVEDH